MEIPSSRSSTTLYKRKRGVGLPRWLLGRTAKSRPSSAVTPEPRTIQTIPASSPQPSTRDQLILPMISDCTCRCHARNKGLCRRVSKGFSRSSRKRVILPPQLFRIELGGWPTFPFFRLHRPYRGCPILAFFARVGG